MDADSRRVCLSKQSRPGPALVIAALEVPSPSTPAACQRIFLWGPNVMCRWPRPVEKIQSPSLPRRVRVGEDMTQSGRENEGPLPYFLTWATLSMANVAVPRLQFLRPQLCPRQRAYGGPCGTIRCTPRRTPDADGASGLLSGPLSGRLVLHASSTRRRALELRPRSGGSPAGSALPPSHLVDLSP